MTINHEHIIVPANFEVRSCLVLSIQWFIANKVLVELLKLNPDLAKQVANTLVIAKTFNKENHVVISALLDAEDHSIEDNSGNLRRAGP